MTTASQKKESLLANARDLVCRHSISIVAVMAFAAIVSAATLFHSPPGQAQTEQDDRYDSRIEEGFDIAPVPLDLEGKNRALVGLGSYLVNAVAVCNDCHSAGPQTQFAPGGNPFFGQPTKINPATYLGGGLDFGPWLPTPGSPHIVSRNLTPDKTGLPEGGRSFSEFLQILRTGVDLDHLHPPCSPTMTTNCLPPPFDGNLLQIMPWPTHKNMTEHDIRAIYEYLSAILCIEGPPPPSVLHNDCRWSRAEFMDFLAGQAAGLVQEIKPAGEIIREVAEQAEHILRTRLPTITGRNTFESPKRRKGA